MPSFLQKILTTYDFSKKCHLEFKIFFAFFKYLNHLVCVPSFDSIAVLYPKSRERGGFITPSHVLPRTIKKIEKYNDRLQ